MISSPRKWPFSPYFLLRVGEILQWLLKHFCIDKIFLEFNIYLFALVSELDRSAVAGMKPVELKKGEREERELD